MKIRVGDTVVVMGIGPIGLMAVAGAAQAVEIGSPQWIIMELPT